MSKAPFYTFRHALVESHDLANSLISLKFYMKRAISDVCMDGFAPELIRQAGEDRLIESLGESFVVKWRNFFGEEPELSIIQDILLESVQLCLSEEYYFGEELSIIAPSILWNRTFHMCLTVDFFQKKVLGFATRRELDEMTGWNDHLHYRLKRIS